MLSFVPSSLIFRSHSWNHAPYWSRNARVRFLLSGLTPPPRLSRLLTHCCHTENLVNTTSQNKIKSTISPYYDTTVFGGAVLKIIAETYYTLVLGSSVDTCSPTVRGLQHMGCSRDKINKNNTIAPPLPPPSPQISTYLERTTRTMYHSWMMEIIKNTLKS